MVPEKAQMAQKAFSNHPALPQLEWPYIGAIIGVVYPILRHTLISYMLYRCYPDKILLTSHWYRYCARIIWLYPPFPYSIATSSEIFRHGRPFSFWPRGRDAAGKRKHLSGNSRNNMAPIGTSVCLGQKLNPKNDTYAKTCSFWMQNTSKFWKIASGINILLVVSHTQVAPYHAIFIAPFFLAHQGGYLLVN